MLNAFTKKFMSQEFKRVKYYADGALELLQDSEVEISEMENFVEMLQLDLFNNRVEAEGLYTRDELEKLLHCYVEELLQLEEDILKFRMSN